MPHKWSRDNAGTVRKGWTLRRDCLTCGVEHWSHERPGTLPAVHEYRNGGKVIHVGRHATPCTDHRKVEPGLRIIVEGRKWIVMERPRDGVYRMVMSGNQNCYQFAINYALRAVKFSTVGEDK